MTAQIIDRPSTAQSSFACLVFGVSRLQRNMTAAFENNSPMM